MYVRPHELLRPYIANYTITFPNQNTISDNYTVIPSGSATLVFSFNGKEIKNCLFGAATKIHKVGAQANRMTFLVIIEFQPYGLHQFVRMQQSELTDLILPVDTVDRTICQTIYSALEQSQNIYELLSALDNVFLSCLGKQMINSELALVLEQIINSCGNITVKLLSSQVHYSERHLNRIFNQSIGLNIKSFSRLVRINKAIRLLKKPRNSMAQAALQSGFFDQPHFIHEFQSICSVTPQEYLKNMSDFYNEICKF